MEDVGAALVADREPTVAGEPSERALHHPAVPAQALAAVHATPRDPRGDAALAAGAPAAAVVVRLVGVQLARPAARPPDALPDGRHRVEHRFQHPAVVPIRRGQGEGERDTAGVDQDMALGARPASVRGVRAGELAPLLAATAAPSSEQRPRSTAFARPKRSSKTRCTRAHAPAACQSRSRRRQVMPRPQPISGGSISQGRPDFRTKRMPVSAARLGTGGRPPFGRGVGGGGRGSTSVHSASVTSGLAMPAEPGQPPGVPVLLGALITCCAKARRCLPLRPRSDGGETGGKPVWSLLVGLIVRGDRPANA